MLLFPAPIISSALESNILLSNLFSYTISVCSSLHIRNQVSYPFELTVKVIVLHILMFVFLESRCKPKTRRGRGMRKIMNNRLLLDAMGLR
jgi:hypothetical protein